MIISILQDNWLYLVLILIAVILFFIYLRHKNNKLILKSGSLVKYENKTYHEIYYRYLLRPVSKIFNQHKDYKQYFYVFDDSKYAPLITALKTGRPLTKDLVKMAYTATTDFKTDQLHTLALDVEGKLDRQHTQVFNATSISSVLSSDELTTAEKKAEQQSKLPSAAELAVLANKRMNAEKPAVLKNRVKMPMFDAKATTIAASDIKSVKPIKTNQDNAIPITDIKSDTNNSNKQKIMDNNTFKALTALKSVSERIQNAPDNYSSSEIKSAQKMQQKIDQQEQTKNETDFNSEQQEKQSHITKTNKRKTAKSDINNSNKQDKKQVVSIKDTGWYSAKEFDKEKQAEINDSNGDLMTMLNAKPKTTAEFKSEKIKQKKQARKHTLKSEIKSVAKKSRKMDIDLPSADDIARAVKRNAEKK